jgi:DNA-binding beta-propeller fold protein YncE
VRLSLRAVVAGLVLLALAPPALADERPSPSGSLFVNGRKLAPLGRMTTLGAFPTGGALSPDGRFYWAVDAGRGANAVRIVDVASGDVVQTLPIPGGYVGVAFAPDGKRAYVSGQPGDGDLDPAAKGKDGDVVHVFDVDRGTGRATEAAPIDLPDARDGAAAGDELPQASGVNAWPEGLAVTPDSKLLVVALGQADQVAIVDLAAPKKITLANVGRYPYGVAVDPKRPRAYVTNERDGTVSVLELPSGKTLGTIGVGGPRGNAYAHPQGIVADPTRDAVYVTVTDRDLVAAIDTSRLRLEKLIDVGRPEGIGAAPVSAAVAPGGQTLYVADAGEDAVVGVALADRPATNPVARRFPKARTITQIDRYRRLAAKARAKAKKSPSARRALKKRLASLRSKLLAGAPAKGCSGPTAAQDAAYGKRVVKALAARERARARGVSKAKRKKAYAKAIKKARAMTRPIAPCAPKGFALGAKRFDVLGRFPTAAYTTDVEATPDGKRLVWLAAKGLGSGPNQGDKSVKQQIVGRAGVLATPTDVELAGYTKLADKQVTPTNLRAAPAGSPIVGPGGGPSDKIKYVFYVVKENRTYDQIFGSEPRGLGDPNRQLFDDNGVPGPTGGVTPNAHALARIFPLLDSVYANSEESTTGHKITSGGYANDYTNRYVETVRGRKGNPDIFPIGQPPNAFVFDQAVRQNLTFRAYGELGAGNQPFADDGRPTYDQVAANTDYSYPSQINGTCRSAIPVPAGAPLSVRCTTDAGTVGVTNGAPAANSRIRAFANQFQTQVTAGTVPRFNYLILFNDHTDGTTPGVYTPKADVADNDLALGQLVQLVSQSSIWNESAIFVQEDDSQDGIDSVDAHRIPAFVISPWAKKGAVVSTRYDQYSFLRTASLILGLKPLSLNDAFATPLYDAFISGSQQPDVEGTRYTAIQPEQSLTETNPANAPNARLSAALPYDRTDVVPQSISDRILWQSVFGADSTPPPPGPNASPIERGRARGALLRFRNGVSPREWLLETAEEDGDD